MVKFKKAVVDKENDEHEFDIEYSFNRGLVPDTNQAPFDINVMSPDFDSWDKWMHGGSLGLFPYLTEFIGREITG